MANDIRFSLFGYVGTAVIYVRVNSLVLTFERTLSATLLLGLVVAFYLLNPQPKEPQTGFFYFGGEGGITHLCIFKCTGCANLMSLTKVIVGKRTNLKNKLCAGLEAHANDTLSPPCLVDKNAVHCKNEAFMLLENRFRFCAVF